MLGPVQPTALIKPHPIEVRTGQYSDAAFCARCHSGTYEQWKQSPLADKQTCQQCHMPQVERKSTQAIDMVSSWLVSFEKAGPQRKHTFAIPPVESLAGMFDLKVTFSSGRSSLEVVNRTPHSLPTGDYGFQAGVIETTCFDSNNTPVRQDRIELVQELKTHLPSGQSRQWSFDLPPSAAHIQVRLLRCGRSLQDVRELFAREITIP